MSVMWHQKRNFTARQRLFESSDIETRDTVLLLPEPCVFKCVACLVGCMATLVAFV